MKGVSAQNAMTSSAFPLGLGYILLVEELPSYLRSGLKPASLKQLNLPSNRR